MTRMHIQQHSQQHSQTHSHKHAHPAVSHTGGLLTAPLRNTVLAWATALPLLGLAVAMALAAPPVQAQTTNAAEWTEAEVRKLDRDANKLTLKHAEIKSLDMPPMTMVFQARDKAMLEGLQVGSKIRFRAGRDKGQYMVMEIQKAP